MSSEIATLGDLSTDELIERLAAAAAITVEKVAEMSSIVAVLDDRGATIPLPRQILSWLRRIGRGAVVPELYLNCGGNRLLLSRAATLPIEDQRRIANNEPYEVWEEGGDHRNVPIQEMSPVEIQQVIGFGEVRTATEQISWLRSRKVGKVTPPIPVSDVRPDYRRRGLVVTGSAFLSIAAMKHYIEDIENSRRSKAATA